MGQQLHAVADAEDGEAGLEDPGGGLRGAVVVDGGGAAGEDEAARVEALDLLPGGVVGDELAVDVALADAAGDEHASTGSRSRG